jgi:soluble lytic murein transglycosylase-like protein
MKAFSYACLAPALALSSIGAHADIYRTWDAQTGVVTYTNIKPLHDRYELIVREQRRQPEPQAQAEQPAPAPAQLASRSLMARGNVYASHISAAAQAYNVEPALLRAVMAAESGYNPQARSPAGAVGLMQLMPGTAQRYGVSNRLDPAQSIHGGARYLRDLLNLFNNDMQLALAAYNAGEEAVMRYGRRIPPFRETVHYVPKVLRFYQQFRGQ